MSLINDALRRANQTKKEQISEPSDGAPMQPVPPVRTNHPFLGPMALIVLLALVLSLASWLFWRAWQAKSKAVSTQQTTVAPQQSLTSESAAPTPALESKSGGENVIATAPALETKTNLLVNSTGLVDAANPADNAAPSTHIAAAVPSAPTLPSLKLQGIFYRLSNPTAMINGRSMAVGETISGARVTRIDRQKVTVEWNGQTIELEMQ